MLPPTYGDRGGAKIGLAGGTIQLLPGFQEHANSSQLSQEKEAPNACAQRVTDFAFGPAGRAVEDTIEEASRFPKDSHEQSAQSRDLPFLRPDSTLDSYARSLRGHTDERLTWRAWAGETLLILGVGTGLELPSIPGDVRITVTDLSPDMLADARARDKKRTVTFAIMDAQQLGFPDGRFNAVLPGLILSVVPECAGVSRGMARVVSWRERCHLR